MQVFKPFRATVHRQQKYYSQKRINDKVGSIFNLPRQVYEQPQTIIITPNMICNINSKIRSFSNQNKTLLYQYNKNHKKAIKKNSNDILNKKALQKAALSIIVTDKNKKSTQKISKNKSLDSVNNKNMSFQTLNILYRTIIQTKVQKKSKPKFQVNARKLPILQKSLLQNTPNQDTKHTMQVLVRNTPFSNGKRSPSNSKDNNEKSRGLRNGQTLRSRGKNLSSFSLSQQNEKLYLASSHKRRFERRPSTSMGMNEIVPWNQVLDVEHQSMYYIGQFDT